MTREEAEAAMIDARNRRGDAAHAVERQFRAHRKLIQSQCPHDGVRGRILAPSGKVSSEWCATCDFEFPAKCKKENDQ